MSAQKSVRRAAALAGLAILAVSLVPIAVSRFSGQQPGKHSEAGTSPAPGDPGAGIFFADPGKWVEGGFLQVGLLALVVPGMILLVGHFDLKKRREVLGDSIEQTAIAISKSQKEGLPILGEGIICAEMVLLTDRLDEGKILTELRESERSIARAEKTVREVLNSIYDAVIVLDEDLKLIWINRRMEIMFQINRRELEGLELVNFADSKREAVRFVTGIRTAWQADNQIFECQCRRFVDGESFPAEVFAQRVSLPAANIVCASIRDVTESKASERALHEALDAFHEAKNAADRANSAKSEFLARMSHEIRTPMNAILGLAYLTRKSTTDMQAAKGLEKIHRSGLGLLRILNDILDFSKLESGKVAIVEEAFSTGELVGVVSDLAAMRMGGKPLRFLPAVDPSVPKTLKGDAFRIQQVLTNLIENAIKFTAEGEIGMRVCYDADLEMIQFEIQDQGIGITPEQQSRLFQSFEQADGTTTRRYGGSGLGLAISKKLVELMGGTIRVSSESTRGATFFFQVSARACSDDELLPAGDDAEYVRSQLADRRILIVDDLEINREIAGEMIREAGCVVGFAEGGSRAIEQVRASPWDLILLDLEMPEMDGFATARAIRAIEVPGLPRVPIIAMSAHAFDEYRLKATEAGMDGYVMKPVDIAVLHAEILRTISAVRPPSAVAPDSGLAPVDSERALKLLGGNKSLYRRMAAKFVKDWAGAAGKIETLVEENAEEAHRLAHSLKGLAASLGAASLSHAAAEIEKLLAQGDRTGALNQIPTLKSELGAAVPCLAESCEAPDNCLASQPVQPNAECS